MLRGLMLLLNVTFAQRIATVPATACVEHVRVQTAELIGRRRSSQVVTMLRVQEVVYVVVGRGRLDHVNLTCAVHNVRASADRARVDDYLAVGGSLH